MQMDEEKGSVLSRTQSNTTTSLRPSVTSSFRIDSRNSNNLGTPTNVNNYFKDHSTNEILDELELSEVSLHSISRISDTPDSSILPGKKLAYAIFVILGIGSLIPFQAFITSSSYYLARFCGTTFSNSFESFFIMFYTASQPIGLWITILYQDNTSIRSLVLYPLIIYSTVFILITLLVVITATSADVLFSLTLIGISFCGFCGALMNGGLFGLSGLLPTYYTGGIMNGQALAGFTVSAVNLLILSVSATERYCANDDNSGATNDDSSCNSSNDVNFGALAFYSLATTVLLLCIVLFLVLLKLEYVGYFLKLYYKERMESAATRRQLTSGDTTNNPMFKMTKDDQTKTTVATAVSESNNHHWLSESVNIDGGSGSNPSQNEGSTGSSLTKKQQQQQHTQSESKPAVNRVFTSDMVMSLIEDIDKAAVNGHHGGSSSSLTSNPINISENGRLSGAVNKDATTGGGTDGSNSSNPSRPVTMGGSGHHVGSLSFHTNMRSTAIVPQEPKKITDSNFQDILMVMNTIKIPAFSVFIVFAGTLTIFPSTMVLIQSQSSCLSKYNSLFIPILFTIFNLCDFIGRRSAIKFYDKYQPYYQLWINEKNIWIYAIIRLVIPILICFCNVSNTRFPVLFPYDSIVMILFIALGLTNGFCANLSMMYGPTLVESERSALAGTIMVFCLSSGLLFGACMSYLVLFILTGTG
jgi:MFS family permease